MKILKTVLSAALLLPAIAVYPQEQQETVGVEKSVINAQVGMLGGWVNYEARLGNEFALRTEAGLDAVFTINTYENRFGLAPSINFEPRWYYNIMKRSKKGKFIGNNSASFLTVSLKYLPDSFVVSDFERLNVPNQLYIIPKWGIRRSVARSGFHYEAGIGIGYFTILDDVYFEEVSGLALDLHLRIGYSF